jgi:uncharacterized protein
MALDQSQTAPQHVAVVGGGISGLATAWLLSAHHRVTLYDAACRLGGHARTVRAGKDATQAVDTGFIVFNYVTYPHLTQLFRALDVPVERSDMGFAVSADGGRIEYALRSLDSLIGQRRNLVRPGFHGMLRDLGRFNARAEELAANDPDLTIDALMEALGMGRWFREYYLRPFCGAIWSTSEACIGAFPARSLLRFMSNHALLSATGQHQWWTVSGGSAVYVERLSRALAARGVEIRTSTPVRQVRREGDGVTIDAATDLPRAFDQVVLATHADVALSLLATPTSEERASLGAIRFQDNRAVLHGDRNQMPLRRRCWASWVVRAGESKDGGPIGVTYWMNRLQNIPEDDPLFVTLNAGDIPERHVYDCHTFRHPVFDHAALAAQSEIAAFQGRNRTWFAGAWLRNGFHEDGFASAQRIARQFVPVAA